MSAPTLLSTQWIVQEWSEDEGWGPQPWSPNPFQGVFSDLPSAEAAAAALVAAPHGSCRSYRVVQLQAFLLGVIPGLAAPTVTTQA